MKSSTLILTKELGTFDAAHQLPHHQGKCANLHGHTYKVIAYVEGVLNRIDGSSSEGMVIDFSILKDVYKRRIESVIDHTFMLGEVPLPWVQKLTESHDLYIGDLGIGKLAYLPIPVTTAEFLSYWMVGELWSGLSESTSMNNILRLTVEVFETPTSSASSEIVNIWREADNEPEG